MQRRLCLAQLLCALLLVTGPAQAASRNATLRSIKPSADKYAIMPAWDLVGTMCRLVTDNLQLVPWPIRPNDICENLGLNSDLKESAICPMFDIAKMLLGYLQGMYPMQCSPEGIPQPSSQDPMGRGLPLPHPFVNTLTERGLPARHDNPNLVYSERPSYYWLIKNIMRLQAWAACGALGDGSPWVPPEGWELLAVLDAPEDLTGYSIKQANMPWAAVLRRSSSAKSLQGCRAFMQGQRKVLGRRVTRAQHSVKDLCSGHELVVLVRGTASAGDWSYNFDMSTLPHSETAQGVMHYGFLRLSDNIWMGGLRDLLDQHGAGASSVTFAGHSLGAAAAALLASRTENHFAGRTTHVAIAATGPQVNAILFASPNVGDATFSADFNRRVNARNIVFANDMVPQVPCIGSMVECTSANAQGSVPPAGAAAGAGAGAGAASNGTRRTVTIRMLSYERMGGRIELTPEHMPYHKDAWRQLSVYTQEDFCSNMMSMANLNEAVHVCSYMCAFSDASTDSAGHWCLLWPEGEAEAGPQTASYCMSGFSFLTQPSDYPTSPLFPSRKDQTWVAMQPYRKGPQNKAAAAALAAGIPLGGGTPVTAAGGHHHRL